MKKSINLTALIMSLVGLTALAQDPGSVARTEVAGRDIAGATGWTPGVAEPATSTLGDQQEIFLLQESQIFFVRSYTNPVYTSNAFYDFTEIEDWYVQQFITAGAETILAEKYYVLAEVGTSFTRYDQYSSLDRDTMGVHLAGSTSLSEKLSVGVNYRSTWFFDSGFDDNDSTFHSVALYGALTSPLPGGGTLQWVPTVSQIWANPDDYNQIGVGLNTNLSIPLSEKTTFGLNGGINYVWYDQYFEESFGVQRQDLALSAGAYVVHRPLDNVEIRLGVDFTNNDSTLNPTDFLTGRNVDLYDYDIWNFRPTIEVGIHF